LILEIVETKIDNFLFEFLNEGESTGTKAPEAVKHHRVKISPMLLRPVAIVGSLIGFRLLNSFSWLELEIARSCGLDNTDVDVSASRRKVEDAIGAILFRTHT
jgi:hypothetical protein